MKNKILILVSFLLGSTILQANIFYPSFLKIDPICNSQKQNPIDITPEKIFENYFKAIGGRENIKKIKDVTITSTASIQGQQIEVLQLFKLPNLFKSSTTIPGMGEMINNFDGKKGTIILMGQKQELTGGPLEAVKLQYNLFYELSYKEDKIKYSLQGIEKLNERDVYKINLTLSDSTVRISDYYDVQTGLKVRKSIIVANAPQGANTQVFDYSNYKEVNGVKFPYTTTAGLMGQNFSFQVQKIEVNKSLSDDLFIVK